MDAISVRDRMIDFELQEQAMAQASQEHYGEPGLRQTVRALGRVLVHIGEALIVGGRRLENYEVVRAGVRAPHGQAG